MAFKKEREQGISQLLEPLPEHSELGCYESAPQAAAPLDFEALHGRWLQVDETNKANIDSIADHTSVTIRLQPATPILPVSMKHLEEKHDDENHVSVDMNSQPEPVVPTANEQSTEQQDDNVKSNNKQPTNGSPDDRTSTWIWRILSGIQQLTRRHLHRRRRQPMRKPIRLVMCATSITFADSHVTTLHDLTTILARTTSLHEKRAVETAVFAVRCDRVVLGDARWSLARAGVRDGSRVEVCRIQREAGTGREVGLTVVPLRWS